MSMSPELARFIVAFKIVPTSLISLPRDLSNDPSPRGDCQDFAKTVKRIEGRFGIMIRCWSKTSFPIPRHAVMWIKGKGFIDSTHREYRRTPWPHFPLWPVGTPFIAAALWSAHLWGFL